MYSCALCAFSGNDPNQCDLCGEPRQKKSPAPKQAHASSRVSRPWQCPVCEHENQEGQNECSLCATPKATFKKRQQPQPRPRPAQKSHPEREEPRRDRYERKYHEPVIEYEVKREPSPPRIQLQFGQFVEFRNPRNNGPTDWELAQFLYPQDGGYAVNTCEGGERVVSEIREYPVDEKPVRGESIEFWHRGQYFSARVTNVRDDGLCGLEHEDPRLPFMVPLNYIRKASLIQSQPRERYPENVIREYCKDILAGMVKEALYELEESHGPEVADRVNPESVSLNFDELMDRLRPLGITSDTTYGRIVDYFDVLKFEVVYEWQEQIREEMNHRVLMEAHGYVWGISQCGQCNRDRDSCLRLERCDHIVCKECFVGLLDTYINNQDHPVCVVDGCSQDIDPQDLAQHGGTFRYQVIQQYETRRVLDSLEETEFQICGNCDEKHDMVLGPNDTSWLCPSCSMYNCVACKKAHGREVPCATFGFRERHSFRSYWSEQDQEVELVNVVKDSPEWKEVSDAFIPGGNEITEIQRVQNITLWRAYEEYASKLPTLIELRTWHGTRANDPASIHTASGFDLKYARVGGCLWFAEHSNYSRRGYQYQLKDGSGRVQLFLALIADDGQKQTVKKISGGRYNVYKNEATYPAYLVTYK